jgi:uncharacterized protein YeaC (DUF1315 family)
MASHDNLASVQSIDLTKNTFSLFSGHLNLGGESPSGETIEFNNYYMLRNGAPCIPVMGEYHFSRAHRDDWEDELLKIKAGGIDIVATYVFWIHIEEDEGVFNWSGNNDLRHFIELCDKHGLQTLVRIGPFDHGECRNGGLPDWLYGRPFRVRSNDEGYLFYARRLYGEIAQQLKGLFFKDGGSIIGIQLDNEYMHCGAPWEVTFRQGREWVPAGWEGVEHIIKLKQIAHEVGLEAPIYTCTGWLNSPIIDGETLPMQGGYAFTPWSPDPDYRQAPTREFLFRNRHLNPVLNGKPTYDAAKYPYVCCEIGGGIQITYYHRPIVPPQAVEGLAVMNLAGGANLIGYYMVHGGTNPVGKHNFLNEYTVPRISYDFQAPIREFGQIADSYRSLRLLHTFLKDFGELLAPMSVTIPDNASLITPEDTTTLRYAVRSKEGAGFVFLNNYQDHVETQAIPDIRLQLRMIDETISIPHEQPLTLEKNVTAILPFGLSLDGILLRHATTQLLCKIEERDAVNYFFFAPRGMVSEYGLVSYETLDVKGADTLVEGDCTYLTVQPDLYRPLESTNENGKWVRFFTLTREQAEHSTKQMLWGKERLIISETTIVPEGDTCALYSIGQEEIELLVYPPMERNLATPYGTLNKSTVGKFTRFTGVIPKKEISLQIEHIGDDKAVINFPADALEGVHNVILRIDYVGDMGSAFIDGKLVHDNFYNGTTWEIGLKHLPRKELVILITPIVKNTGGARYVPTGMAFRPDAADERIAVIRDITAVAEYKVPLREVK